MKKVSLLLLPGVLCDEMVWAAQIEGLGDIAQSQVPVLDADTPEGMVECALRDAPERFALAGHSMGGWVALEVVRRYPERVTRLCLMTTSADLDPPDVLDARKQPYNESIVERWVFDPAVRPRVRVMLNRNRHLWSVHQSALMKRSSSLDLLPMIRQETLVIAAGEDAQFLETTKQIAEQIPNAHLEIIPDSGHMVTLEKPQVVTELMRNWLEI